MKKIASSPQRGRGTNECMYHPKHDAGYWITLEAFYFGRRGRISSVMDDGWLVYWDLVFLEGKQANVEMLGSEIRFWMLGFLVATNLKIARSLCNGVTFGKQKAQSNVNLISNGLK